MIPASTATVGATCASVPSAVPKLDRGPGEDARHRDDLVFPSTVTAGRDVTVVGHDHERGRVGLERADQPSDVGVDLAGDLAVLLGLAAVRVAGLVEVGKVHDEQLRVGRLGDAQRIVHERARKVAALGPRPQRGRRTRQ